MWHNMTWHAKVCLNLYLAIDTSYHKYFKWTSRLILMLHDHDTDMCHVIKENCNTWW